MKKLRPISRIAGRCLVLALALGAVVETQAQVNENKVRREAAGRYSGTTKGGRIVQVYKDPATPNEAGKAPSMKAKIPIPVKKGKLSSSIKDPEVGKVVFSGKGKRADVKRVIIDYQGTAKDNEPDTGPLKGRTKGQLDKKGSKWHANTKMNGKQANPADVVTVTGVSFKGRK